MEDIAWPLSATNDGEFVHVMMALHKGFEKSDRERVRVAAISLSSTLPLYHPWSFHSGGSRVIAPSGVDIACPPFPERIVPLEREFQRATNASFQHPAIKLLSVVDFYVQ